eukprot:TRINITY_DN5964_c0_g1_i1.p1 TRINITY_DN5964_c0_g1~~TRINITY_DN5964_c0_g1_i1.p1  ORF type:complete len:343 (-),score=78.26 TRINITY_DN5964_c0_g1_i1:102-1130(-)
MSQENRKTLKEIFQHHSEDQIRNALLESGDKLENAAELLTKIPASLGLQPPQIPKKPRKNGWSAYSATYRLHNSEFPGYVGFRPDFFGKYKKREGEFPTLERRDVPEEVLDFLSDMFPDIDRKDIQNRWINCNGNLCGTVDELIDRDKKKTKNFREKNSVKGKRVEKEDKSKKVHVQKRNKFGKDDSPDIYRIHRRSAVKASNKRNKLFKMATSAYERGEYGKAKQLVDEGRKQSRIAWEYNKQAAERIFEYQNDRLGLSEIDFHGLHVDEAVAFLEERLELLNQDSSVPQLVAITGVGNHQFANAMLRPAIMEFLNDRKFKFYESRPGQFVISVKRPKMMT